VFGNKKKQEQAINLVQSGSVGVGTLTNVADTGIPSTTSTSASS